MPLILEYRGGTTLPLEVDGILPANVAGRSIAEIERLPVQHGNRQATLGEFFTISGNVDDGGCVWRGDLQGVHRIGEAMADGWLRVEGDAGRHVGARMQGGRIDLVGSASDWLGAELRRGLIHVRGDAGRAVGAAYIGSPSGMTGGMILIDGNVGDEAGHTMRRGVIAVGGYAGAFAAISMIAGTVLVAKGCGPRPAAGMRRGSLVMGHAAAPLLPTFQPTGPVAPVFLNVYLRRLRELGWSAAEHWPAHGYEQFSGDHLNGGRGEVLVGRRV
jgi:formylmethanofuran dehydrogenase subunit C